jgi:hypothetical protein
MVILAMMVYLERGESGNKYKQIGQIGFRV